MAENNPSCLPGLDSFMREEVHEWYNSINRETQPGLARHNNVFIISKEAFMEPDDEV